MRLRDRNDHLAAQLCTVESVIEGDKYSIFGTKKSNL